MKYLRTLIGTASIVGAIGVNAGEAVFYINEEGQPAGNIAVAVNGEKKLVQKSGFVSFDVGSGEYQVELSQFGEWLGEFSFSTENSAQNAEIRVDILGGEALPEINIYTPGSEQAAAIGKISGMLQSAETGGVVSGARISAEGMEEAGVMTDDNGYFELELPRGQYNIIIAHPNYGKRTMDNVRVFSNLAINMNVSMNLSGDGVIEELVATGTYMPNTAVAQKRDASSILESIGAEQFSKFGDSDAAAALKRVSGVSVIGGQYAVIRGLTGRYNASTMNGGLLPSTNPLKRDVPLDLFPSGVLQGIEIKKGYTPDLFGDSTGGTINMVTKGMPDANGGKVSVGLGGVTGVTFRDVISYDGGDTDFLGIDDGTREMPSSIDSATDYGQNGYNVCDIPELCLSNNEVAVLASDLENIYNTKTTKATPDVSLGLSYGGLLESSSGNFGYYGDVSYSNKWRARQDASITDGSGNYDYERSKQSIDLSAYMVLGYQDAIGNHEILSRTLLLRKTDDTTRKAVGEDRDSTAITDITLQWVEQQYLGQTFSGEHFFDDRQHEIDWRLTTALSTRYEPDRRSYQYRNGQIFPATLERRFTDQSETSVDVSVDYTWHWQINSFLAGRLKTGLFLASKERETEMGRLGFVQGAGVNTAGQDLENLLVPANFYNGNFVMQVKTDPTDSYEASDDMTAFYLNSETDFGTAWTLLLGARFEDASQELRYPNAVVSNNTYNTSEILPALGLTWRVNEQWQLRAGISQTVARPGLTERSLTSQYDPETDEQVFGNANLVFSSITNIDFRAEYYFSDEDSISVALFTKLIEDPIERTVPDASGSASDGYTFQNQDSATVSGIEFDARYTVLNTDNFSGFLAGNLALIDSEVELSGRSIALEGGIKTRKLQGQSDVLANVQFGLDHLPSAQTVTFLVNYFDDRIYKVLRGKNNEVEDGRVTVDVVYKYPINEQLSFGGKVQNLFNQKVSYSIDGHQSETYKDGTTIKLGMDYSF